MHSDVVRECLEALYIRFRKRIPDNFDAEVTLACRDLYNYQEHELPEMFAYAAKHAEGDKMPLVKDIIKAWTFYKGDRQSILSSCKLCNNGLISVQDNEGKWVSVRCVCAMGEQQDKRIVQYVYGYNLVRKGEAYEGDKKAVSKEGEEVSRSNDFLQDLRDT